MSWRRDAFWSAEEQMRSQLHIKRNVIHPHIPYSLTPLATLSLDQQEECGLEKANRVRLICRWVVYSVTTDGRACRSALFSWVASKSGISRCFVHRGKVHTHPVPIKADRGRPFQRVPKYTRVGLRMGTKKMTRLGCMPPPIDSQKRATFTIPSEINRHTTLPS